MTSFYLNVLVSGLLIGIVYALIALGLTIIFGVMRVVNFAHGEMVVIGMYAGYWMWTATHLPPWLLAIPAGALLFVVGYWLQKLIINAYIDRPQHAQFILFISLALIITGLHLVLFGPDPRPIQDPMTMQSYTLGALRLDKVRVAGRADGAAAHRRADCLSSIFYAGTLDPGRSRQSGRRAGHRHFGQAVYAITAGIGMACAGAAGALISPMFDTQPFLATDFTLIAFIIVIVGGLGSLTGALLGGVLIGLAEAIAALAFSPALKTTVFLRLAGFGAAAAAEWPVRRAGAVMRSLCVVAMARARLLRVPGRHRLLLDSFWQSLLTLVFFYAFMGMTWNLMMTRGPAVAWPCAVPRSRRLCDGGFHSRMGGSPWLAIAAGAAIFRRWSAARSHGSACRFSVRGVQFALLTIAFAELARVLFDNWDFVGGTGRLFPEGDQSRHQPAAPESLRGGTLFFYLAFVPITAAAYFLIVAP